MKWLLVLVCACDWSLHRMQEQPKCTVHTELAGTPCDLAPPDGIVALHASEPARPPLSRALIERGRDRFDRICAPCHGVAGDGDSDVARVMTQRKPPSLVGDDARKLWDDRIFFVITHGYGMMPSYGGTLTVPDRWAVLAFVRALQAREVPAEEASPWLH